MHFIFVRGTAREGGAGDFGVVRLYPVLEGGLESLPLFATSMTLKKVSGRPGSMILRLGERCRDEGGVQEVPMSHT